MKGSFSFLATTVLSSSFSTRFVIDAFVISSPRVSSAISKKINEGSGQRLLHIDRRSLSPSRSLWSASKHASNPLEKRNRPLQANSNVDDATKEDECDVLVLGSGPAARALATLLSSPISDGTDTSTSSSSLESKSLDIVVADANYDRQWVPNYGVWEDEWESIRDMFASPPYRRELGDECIDRLWGKTDCFFGGSFDIEVTSRMRLDRSYCRIDRHALRDALSPSPENEDKADGNESYRVIRANHISKATSVNIYSPAGSLVHDEFGSTILLRSKGGEATRVRAKLIVDCTGHESRIVLKDDRVRSTPPGYQIAYGMLAKLDESSVADTKMAGPYDKEAMTLFDYRTDHFLQGSAEERKAEKAPTFMYVMPLNDNRVFFEETSLVARPAVSFAECKERCMTRLNHLGITVQEIEEEEYCYIPMGGPLPAKDQRVIGFGGSAAMVHPSTGYHLCRAMMGAGAVAHAIRSELAPIDSPETRFHPDRAAARAYNAMWSQTNIAQRNFAVFGGEFLMKQNVVGLRGFFDGFFKLPLHLWAGFLAGWPGLPNNTHHETWIARLIFGLNFIARLPLPVALDMFASIVSYSITEGIALPQSVTPFFGLPDTYNYKTKEGTIGDVAAKIEARNMIQASTVEDLVPVDFEEGNTGGNASNQINTSKENSNKNTKIPNEDENNLQGNKEEVQEEKSTTFA